MMDRDRRTEELALSRRIAKAENERRKQAEEEARRQREDERRPLEQKISLLESRLSTLEAHVRSLSVRTKSEVSAEEQKEYCLKVRKSLLTDREALFVRGPWDPPEVWAVPLPTSYYAPDARNIYLCQRKGTYILSVCNGMKAKSGYVVLGVIS